MDDLRTANNEKVKIPLFIQKRQYQLRSYVLETIFPEVERTRKIASMKSNERKIFLTKMNSIVDECTCVCYIFSLKQFFREGTDAAIKAVDTFKEFNVDGFNIGNKRFEGRNNNVMEGQTLYEELLNNIKNAELKNLIERCEHYYEITERYKNVSI